MTADELKRLRELCAKEEAFAMDEELDVRSALPRLLDEIERLRKIEAAAKLIAPAIHACGLITSEKVCLGCDLESILKLGA